MFQQPLKDDKKHSVATAVSNLRTTVKICPKVMRKKEKETNSKTNKQQKKKSLQREMFYFWKSNFAF